MIPKFRAIVDDSDHPIDDFELRISKYTNAGRRVMS